MPSLARSTSGHTPGSSGTGHDRGGRYCRAPRPATTGHVANRCIRHSRVRRRGLVPALAFTHTVVHLMTPTDDIIKALGFASGALLPFASAPYTLKLIPSTDVNAVKLQTKLKNNVQASFTTYPNGQKMRVPFSM